jgi:hypothetical protein
MHDGASKFVAAAAAVLPAGLRVIEFGSRDVNGSIRDHFKTAGSYLGVDILPGPGVNLIRDAATFDRHRGERNQKATFGDRRRGSQGRRTVPADHARQPRY